MIDSSTFTQEVELVANSTQCEQETNPAPASNTATVSSNALFSGPEVLRAHVRRFVPSPSRPLCPSLVGEDLETLSRLLPLHSPLWQPPPCGHQLLRQMSSWRDFHRLLLQNSQPERQKCRVVSGCKSSDPSPSQGVVASDLRIVVPARPVAGALNLVAVFATF
jgi:hypothetical protein